MDHISTKKKVTGIQAISDSLKEASSLRMWHRSEPSIIFIENVLQKRGNRYHQKISIITVPERLPESL